MASMDVDGAIANKRGPPLATYAFYARFPSAILFKSWITGIASILHECSFDVFKSEEFSGLRVESIDRSKACMIQSRLPTCALDCAATKLKAFRIRLNNLALCLKSTTSTQFVDLWSLEDTCEIYVAIFEPDVDAYHYVNCIKTLEDDESDMPMEEMAHRIFVEVDMALFKATIRSAREHRGRTLQLRVYVSRGACADAKPSAVFVVDYKGDEVSGVVRLCGYGDVSQYRAGGDLTITAADGDLGLNLSSIDDYEAIFKASFSVEYLSQIANLGDKAPALIRLGAELPLFIEVPYGSGGFTRFVLAPNVDDSC
jgi:hypothetical protein